MTLRTRSKRGGFSGNAVPNGIRWRLKAPSERKRGTLKTLQVLRGGRFAAATGNLYVVPYGGCPYETMSPGDAPQGGKVQKTGRTRNESIAYGRDRGTLGRGLKPQKKPAFALWGIPERQRGRLGSPLRGSPWARPEGRPQPRGTRLGAP